MEKRYKYILGTIIVLLIITSLVYLYLDSNSRKVDKAVSLIKKGDYEAGLSVCDDITVTDYSDVCYVTYIGIMINNQLPFDKEICSKISSRRDAEKEAIGCL